MDRTMTKVHVGNAADFESGDRKLIEVDGNRIGVFRVEDGDEGFVAYLNVCAHQGGPICEGQYFPTVWGEVDEQGVLLGERLDKEHPHLVCPWHAWEYDLQTGEMVGDRRIRLHRYEVVVEAGEIYVQV